LPNCRQCGAALPSVTFGDVSDYCADCRKQLASTAEPKHDLIEDLPQISASKHSWLNATTVLLAINCLVFVLMTIRGASPILPDTDQLLRWGANYGPYTLGGQYWRLVTCAFLHIGILHLGLNMWVFWRLGKMLEKLIGAFMVTGVYVLTGIGASLLSLSWNPMRVSAGASGAIFGIVGVLISLLYFAKLDIPQERMSRLRGYVTRLALYNLFYGLFGHVDNMAHLGGLLTGLVIGFFLARSIVAQPQELFRQLRVLILAGCALLVIFVPVARAKSYAVELDRAQTALRNRDYNAAIEHLERYNRAHEDLYGHAALGYAYQSAGRYPEAATEYQHALKLEPDSPAVEVALAEVYQAQGKSSEAVPLFAKSISKAKSDSDDYLSYGQALVATEDYHQAESVLRKAISLDGKNAQSHLELAKVLRALNRNPEARKEDEQAAVLQK
jgi:membrane associated rhomboid family serine protease/Flp pilus assembly protein TadD